MTETKNSIIWTANLHKVGDQMKIKNYKNNLGDIVEDNIEAFKNYYNQKGIFICGLNK